MLCQAEILAGFLFCCSWGLGGVYVHVVDVRSASMRIFLEASEGRVMRLDLGRFKFRAPASRPGNGGGEGRGNM